MPIGHQVLMLLILASLHNVSGFVFGGPFTRMTNQISEYRNIEAFPLSNGVDSTTMTDVDKPSGKYSGKIFHSLYYLEKLN